MDIYSRITPSAPLGGNITSSQLNLDIFVLTYFVRRNTLSKISKKMVKKKKSNVVEETEDINQKCVHFPLKFNTLSLLTVCWSVRDITVIYVVIFYRDTNLIS